MLGTKRIAQLEGIAARLEAVAGRLDRHDGLAVEQSCSPVVTHEIQTAAAETVGLIFGEINTLLAAGEQDRGPLKQLATGPVIRALGGAPPAQQASARLTFISNLLSLLVDRIAERHQGAARVEKP